MIFFPTGYTAGLVKEPGVYVGLHTLVLNISGKQGEYSIHNIRVTVCSCSVEPNCTSSRKTRTQAGLGAIIIPLASLLLVLRKKVNHLQSVSQTEYTVICAVANWILSSPSLTVLLLLSVKVICKKEFTPLWIDDFPQDILLRSNTEGPGTDCEVTAQRLSQETLIHFQIFLHAKISNCFLFSFLSSHSKVPRWCQLLGHKTIHLIGKMDMECNKDRLWQRWGQVDVTWTTFS